jgi:hypothetical protein
MALHGNNEGSGKADRCENVIYLFPAKRKHDNTKEKFVLLFMMVVSLTMAMAMILQIAILFVS